MWHSLSKPRLSVKRKEGRAADDGNNGTPMHSTDQPMRTSNECKQYSLRYNFFYKLFFRCCLNFVFLGRGRAIHYYIALHCPMCAKVQWLLAIFKLSKAIEEHFKCKGETERIGKSEFELVSEYDGRVMSINLKVGQLDNWVERDFFFI